MISKKSKGLGLKIRKLLLKKLFEKLKNERKLKLLKKLEIKR
jgi:hypothetical protein